MLFPSWFVRCALGLTWLIAQFRTLPRGRSFIQVRPAWAGPLRPSFRRVGLHGVRPHVCRPPYLSFGLLVSTSFLRLKSSSPLISALISPPSSGPISKCTPTRCVRQHILMYSVSYTCPRDRFSPLCLLPLSHRTFIHRFLIVLRCIYIYHRPLSSLENAFPNCCLFSGRVLLTKFRSPT